MFITFTDEKLAQAVKLKVIFFNFLQSFYFILFNYKAFLLPGCGQPIQQLKMDVVGRHEVLFVKKVFVTYTNQQLFNIFNRTGNGKTGRASFFFK